MKKEKETVKETHFDPYTDNLFEDDEQENPIKNAFEASKNEILSPLKTQFGYHIIYIRDSRLDKDGEKEILASHILFKIEPSPETLKNLKKESV